MKWKSLAVATIVVGLAASAQAGEFWRGLAPITSQVYHAGGAELAGDTPHRWYHQPVGYGLHVDHGYYSGNAWYNNHAFHQGAFYHGAEGCRNWQGLWSGFCQHKCRQRGQRGCGGCGQHRGRPQRKSCGCGHGRFHGGCGHHQGCGCGHHHGHDGTRHHDAPLKPEAAPSDDAPNPPAPKPDVSAGVLKHWPRPFAFLSGKREG